MKKFIFTFIAFISAIFIWHTPVLAAHTMSEKEHNDFVRDITTIMENFTKDNKKTLRSIKGDVKGIIRYTSTFSDHNDVFDKAHGFDVSDTDLTHCTKTFGQATELYYNHVMDHEAFAKRPLCCRGLSLFVLKYLNDKGIKCFYTQCTYKNIPKDSKDREAHDVITYSKGGEWCVCDLSHAFVAYIVDNYGTPSAKCTCKMMLGYETPIDLLSVPCKLYQDNHVVNPAQTTILPVDILRIDRIGWHTFKFDAIKDTSACAILDHFRHYDPLTDEEIIEYYGPTTREELEGKSKDEIRELFKRQLASKRK